MNLLDQHLQARKKYFENFDRVNTQTRAKLEKNFIESQRAFLEFRDRLKPEDLEMYQKRYEALKPDTTYSSARGIPSEPPIASADIPSQKYGPHHLQTQIESDFSEDNEETHGTIDDYKSYKGIVD